MSKIAEPLQTSLHQLHIEAGAKMVPFAGYNMPIHYKSGIIEEHLHTRTGAGLFDVSHMGQLIVEGDNVASSLEKLMPTDFKALAVNQPVYSVFTSSQGGILDDLIVTRWGAERFFLVVNAACQQQDMDHLQRNLPSCDVNFVDKQSLLALQGPHAREVMAKLTPDAEQLLFMRGCPTTIDGIDCYITRSGYTGEDGFEISVASQDAEPLARKLLSNDSVEWVGLGARDSLRLEAGLCLYGHDMDQYTSPVEANIQWSISRSRRMNGDREGGFLGADVILPQLVNGVSKKRVGLMVEGRAPVREGAQIIDDKGDQVGTVTSGGFAPSLGVPIAMGYVSTEHSKVGTQLNALVRGKPRRITVASMPVVKHRYYRG
jgi:aminomethyltransferase